MAWTGQTFSVGQVLTANQLNNMQADITAVANGDTGAPKIQTAALDTAVVTAAKLEASLSPWVLLDEIDITGSQYATFTNGTNGVVIDSTYDYYMLQWDNVTMNNADSFIIQVGTSGGFITSATYDLSTGSTGQTYIFLGSHVSLAYNIYSGTCVFRFPHTSTQTQLDIRGGKIDTSAGAPYTLTLTDMVAANQTTTAIDRIRIGGAAATHASGTVTLFALRK